MAKKIIENKAYNTSKRANKEIKRNVRTYRSSKCTRQQSQHRDNNGVHCSYVSEKLENTKSKIRLDTKTSKYYFHFYLYQGSITAIPSPPFPNHNNKSNNSMWYAQMRITAKIT